MVQVTLRKANSIQKVIRTEINSLTRVLAADEISVTIFDKDVASTIKNARDNFNAAMIKRDRLTNILYEIRQLVCDANYKSGVTALINETARLGAVQENLQKLATISAAVPLEQIVEDLEIQRQRFEKSPESFRVRENMDVSLMTEDMLREIKEKNLAIARNRRRLDDEILNLNVSTMINISDESYKFLEENGVI
jgi:hypothetical protein